MFHQISRKRSLQNEIPLIDLVSPEKQPKKCRRQGVQNNGPSMLEGLPTVVRDRIFSMSAGSIGSVRLASKAHCGLVNNWSRPDNLPRVEYIKISFAKPRGITIKVEVRIQKAFVSCFQGLREIVKEGQKEDSGITVEKKKERKFILFTFLLPRGSPFFAQLGAALSTRVCALRMEFSWLVWTKEFERKNPFSKHPAKWDLETGNECIVLEDEEEEEKKLEKAKVTVYPSLPSYSDFDGLLGQIEEIGTIRVETAELCNTLGNVIMMLSAKCKVSLVKLAVKFTILDSRPNANLFFGMRDENWMELLMEMYERGAERITLTNHYYQHFKQEQVALVCQEIAAQDLEVFFSTTFRGAPINYEDYGYIAKESKGSPKTFSFRHYTVPEIRNSGGLNQ